MKTIFSQGVTAVPCRGKPTVKPIREQNMYNIEHNLTGERAAQFAILGSLNVQV